MPELSRAGFLFLFILFSGSLYAQDYPKRVISLGPATTDALYLLDAEDRIIANTVY